MIYFVKFGVNEKIVLNIDQVNFLLENRAPYRLSEDNVVIFELFDKYVANIKYLINLVEQRSLSILLKKNDLNFETYIMYLFGKLEEPSLIEKCANIQKLWRESLFDEYLPEFIEKYELIFDKVIKFCLW